MSLGLVVLEKKLFTRTRKVTFKNLATSNFPHTKITKFFCNLEKAKYIDKTIKKVTLQNGKIINNQRDILNQVKCFYADLFSCKNIDEDNLNDFKNTLPNSKQEESARERALCQLTECF